MDRLNIRSENIISYLKRNNLVTVNELVTEIGVSAATIRRDLIELDKMGVIVRTHGGIALKRLFSDHSTISIKNTSHLKEKERMASYAASIIPPKSAIILDTGVTCIELAKRITHLPLHVITADLHIALYLCEFKRIKVTMIGGRIDDTSQSCGIYGKHLLENIYPDIVFVSCDHWDASKGATTSIEEKALLKYAQIKNATKRILIADSSKYKKHSLFRICSLDIFDEIITDSDLEYKYHNDLLSTYKHINLMAV